MENLSNYADMHLINFKELEKESLEHSDVYSVLQFVDPDHSIIIDENIALVGITDEKLDNHSVIATVNSLRHEDKKRGDYFLVVDKQGVKLFELYVSEAGAMIQKGETLGYCFILKDYVDIDEEELLFGNGSVTKAVIIYYNNKLYAKQNYGNKLEDNFEIDKSIKIESIGNSTYKLNFKEMTFVSSVLDKKHRILEFVIK